MQGLAMSWRVCLALLVTVPLGLGLTYADPGIGTLYGTEGGMEGKLYAIDPLTGAASIITETGLPSPSLAVDPTTGILYGGAGNGIDNLYLLDPDTWVWTEVEAAASGSHPWPASTSMREARCTLRSTWLARAPVATRWQSSTS